MKLFIHNNLLRVILSNRTIDRQKRRMPTQIVRVVIERRSVINTPRLEIGRIERVSGGEIGRANIRQRINTVRIGHSSRRVISIVGWRAQRRVVVVEGGRAVQDHVLLG